MDKFLYTFGLSQSQRGLVNNYLSPSSEASVVKSVPLDQLAQVKHIIRICSPGCKLMVKYRGPRYDLQRATCLKQNARSAAIYVY